jgi:hypothetical protein
MNPQRSEVAMIEAARSKTYFIGFERVAIDFVSELSWKAQER